MASRTGIRHLLVANRGEIAVRILGTARELGIRTTAVHTSEDANHAIYADEAILLQRPADFTSIEKIISVAIEAKVDSVHPGYGFLSENPDFATALAKAGILFIGPSADIVRQTSDKTDARALAIANNVPVLPASTKATSDAQEALDAAEHIGFPVMIKAVDGGGGRGIRLVRDPHEFHDACKRAMGESPSGQVFLEKAAVDGFRHVEVQILADNFGGVAHLWERECSIQRRFQKIVEIAPSTIQDRQLVATVIESAMRMAKAIKYSSLGTFEFLVHESKPKFFFLEVNPRLQVEHTISEEISGVDIVRCQLLLAKGLKVEDLQLPTQHLTATAPRASAIQLRVTAEDASKAFMLSVGRITNFQPPMRTRMDTHLSCTRPTTVGSSYDSLLAKLIVRSSTFEEARLKALRALSETIIKGVTTNLNVLAGIASHADFKACRCSTKWLESNLESVISAGDIWESQGSLVSREPYVVTPTSDTALGGTAGLGAGTVLFRKGDAFKIAVSDTANSKAAKAVPEEYLVRLDRVFTNNFPTQVQTDINFTSASTSSTYSINLTSTTQTSVASSQHRMADPGNSSHVALPFAGQFMELSVQEGDEVEENEVICVIRQMKMELEVRAPFGGTVKWVCEAEEGETLNDGLLVCELVPLEGHLKRTVQSPFAKL